MTDSTNSNNNNQENDVQNEVQDVKSVYDMPKRKKKPINYDELEYDGIKSEEFDITKPIEQPDDSAELCEGEGISISYDMNVDEVTQALKKFQKLTLYKKNYIYSAILFIMFVIYVISSVNNPENKLAVFLAAICLAVIGVIWYMPYKHIKETAKAIANQKLNFDITVYDKCVCVGDGENKNILDYTADRIIGFETELVFGIGVGRERVFLIPKRCCEQEQIEGIREKLSNGFGKKYYTDKK